MASSMVWADDAAGGTPINAANLNKLAVVADLGTPGTPTGDALRSAFVSAIGVKPSGDVTGATDTAAWKAAIASAFTTRLPISPAPGRYYINAPLVLKPGNSGTGNVPAFLPSIIVNSGAGHIGDETDDASAVTLEAVAGFPQGYFLIDYQENGSPYAGAGAIVRGFTVECRGRAAGIRAQGIRESRFEQLTIVNAAIPDATLTALDGAKGALSMTISFADNISSAYNVIQQVTITEFAGDGFYDNSTAENTYIACRAFTGQRATGASYHLSADVAHGSTNHHFLDCHYGGAAYGMQIGYACSATVVGLNLFQSVPWPLKNALIIEDGWQYDIPRYHPPAFTNCHFVCDPAAGAATADAADVRLARLTGLYQINAVFTSCVFGSGDSDRLATWVHSDASLTGEATFRDCTFLGATHTAPVDDLAGICRFFNSFGLVDNMATVIGQVDASANSATLTSTPADVPGATLTLAALSPGMLLVHGTFDFQVSLTTDVVAGYLSVDGTNRPEAVVLSGGSRVPASRTWAVPLAKGSHTIKLRAAQVGGTGTDITEITHTGFSYQFVPTP